MIRTIRGPDGGLARILSYTFSTPAEEFNDLREAGYRTWLEKFPTSKMMEDLLGVYNKLGIPRELGPEEN